MLSMTTLNPDHFHHSVSFGELAANGGGTSAGGMYELTETGSWYKGQDEEAMAGSRMLTRACEATRTVWIARELIAAIENHHA